MTTRSLLEPGLMRRVGIGAAIVVLVACASAPAADAARRPLSIFEAPRELLHSSATRVRGTLDELRGLGVDTVRLELFWRQVAPLPRHSHIPGGGFHPAAAATYPAARFGRYDDAIRAASERGLRVLVTISGPVPNWASRSRHSKVENPLPYRFREFAKAVGHRYSGHFDPPGPGGPLPRVSQWGIWNEPNYIGFLAPQYRNGHPVSGRYYRRLYLAGHGGLASSGHRSDTILAGETAPIASPRGVAPLAFMRDALCLSSSWHRQGHCARLPTSGWAHHPYDVRERPLSSPPGRDDVTIGVLGRLDSALAKAGRAGAVRSGLPIYLTEYGVQTQIGGGGADPGRVSPAAQAAYLSYAEIIARGDSRVLGVSQYLLRDEGSGHATGAHARFQTGIRRANGRKKPSYFAYRLPLAVARRGSHRVHMVGFVRPAQRRVRLLIQMADRGHKFHTVRHLRANSLGYYQAGGAYRGGRRWRVVWLAPSGRFNGAPTSPLG